MIQIIKLKLNLNIYTFLYKISYFLLLQDKYYFLMFIILKVPMIINILTNYDQLFLYFYTILLDISHLIKPTTN